MTRSEQLEQMLASSPNDLFLKYAVAMAYSSEGNSAEAERRLADINLTHPDDVASWFQRGKLLAKLGEDDAARGVLMSGIATAQRMGNDHAEGEMRGFLEML